MRCRWMLGILIVSAVLLAPVAGRTVEIGGNTAGADSSASLSLVAALNDSSVDTIVLTGDYAVGKDLPVATAVTPVPVQRNVTIKGAGAAADAVSLDLNFRRAVFVLCATCRVTLKNLSLRNARRGTGAAVDIFVGDDDHKTTAVLLEGLYRHRLACTPGKDATEALETTPRSKHLPASRTGKQEVGLKTVTVQGVTYPNALHLKDFTVDLPLVHQEGAVHYTAKSHSGGYALGSRDVVYVCENLVSEACLAEKSAEACVNELIDSLLAGQSKDKAAASGPNATLLAAVIVPIVVVGALLTGLAVWFLKRRRQRQRDADSDQRKLGLYPSGFSEAFSNGPSGIVSPHSRGPFNGGDSGSDLHSVRSKSQGGRQSLEIAMQPNGQRDGWQLVSSATADYVELPADAAAEEVQFGSFLGAGSYGRVYRARWAGKDVACKVITHDKSTLAAVEAEASLMLTLHHPHVVQAFHYSTFTYTEQAQSDRTGRSSRHGGVGGPSRPSFTASQSSGGSSAMQKASGDSAGALPNPHQQHLGRRSHHTPPHSASNSGSGNSARVLLLRQQQHAQQQQQPVALIARQESSDVLVTNLSLDAQGAQEAVAIAASVAGATSAATTKGSGDTGLSKDASKLQSTQSYEEQGILGAAEGSLALKHKAETWLVQEYCDCGTLGGVASTWDMEAECDEQMVERLQLLRDTAEGLEALHQNHVVHGDINARNVLVSSSSSTPSSMIAKVADLGLARCLAHHATHRTTNSCGTMSHMAPELLRYGRLSPAVDVYAFGIMMWELYHQGQAAFDKLHYGQFFETVVLRKVRPCIPAGMPPDYELLMQQCWAPEPTDRPSVPVLRQCLQVMLQDRQQRVDAAAAAGGEQQPQQQAAGCASPPGDAVLPALQAMLPRQQLRGPSPATGPPTPHPAGGAAGGGRSTPTALVSPGNSSTPLSVVSLSELFPETAAEQQPTAADTVLVIGEPDTDTAAQSATTAPVAAATSAARGTRVAGASRTVQRTAAVAAGPPSPLGDVESQTLDRDPSTRNGHQWFV